MIRHKMQVLTLVMLGLLALTESAANDQAASPSNSDRLPATWQGPDDLGRINFRTSCKDDRAQERVHNGLLLLHNFEYELAIPEFQSAQKIEATCAFAYWGEAMSELRITHFFVNYDSASEIYARMDRAANLEGISRKERALIDATRVFLTTGDRDAPGHDENSSLYHFRKAMRPVYDEWPDDPDIAAFYSLSVIGTRFGVEDFSTNLVAGTAVEKLISSYPAHPGVLHLTLHSYENRWQSWRARVPAETFGGHASASIHSLHMPSHYYYLRGDWDTVIEINRAVWKRAIDRQIQLGLDDDMREYHGLSWAIYAWLQQRHFDQAYSAIVAMLDSAPSARRDYYLAHVIADYILQSPVGTPHRQELVDMDFDISRTNAENQTAYLFARAWHAFTSGDDETAHEMIDRVSTDVSVAGQAQTVVDEVAVMTGQLHALADYHAGNIEPAIARLRQAARREEISFIEHGIPLIIKPSHELLADVLMENQRYGEALRHYKLSAFANPGRRLSIEGIIGSARRINDLEEMQQAESRLNRLLGIDANEFVIVRESNFADEWPERFRTTDVLPELDDQQLLGLRELNIMGGGQPSEKQLANIVARSENPVVVLDFRQEPHGHVGGMPVTWFRPYVSDRDLGTETMMALERDFIDNLRSTSSIAVNSVEWTGGQNYEVLDIEYVGNGTVSSNAEVAEKTGARYRRFHIPVVPNERQLADFEAFVDEVADQDVSLYFHCWDGTGRSTEFMVMYDILKNEGEVSLQTIADRHAALGGINVLQLPPETSPNYSRSVLRRDFIIDYYRRKSEKE